MFREPRTAALLPFEISLSAVDETMPPTADRDPLPVIHRPLWFGLAATGCALLGVAGFAAFLFGSVIAAVASVVAIFDYAARWNPTSLSGGVIGLAYMASLGTLAHRPATRRIGASLTVILAAAAVIAATIAGGQLALIPMMLGLATLYGIGWMSIHIIRFTEEVISDEHWLNVHRDAQRCPYCLYSTRGLIDARCPECGHKPPSRP